MQVRDLYVSTIPLEEKIDKNTLYNFVCSVQKPCCFPEKILYDIAETKHRLDALEKLKAKTEHLETVPKCTNITLNFLKFINLFDFRYFP